MNIQNNPDPKRVFDTLQPIVLASGSPRRRDFLASLGLDFRVEPSRAEEPAPLPGESPDGYARRMAEMKGRETAQRFPDAVIIAADTVVALEGTLLGKPGDDADALRMLRLLAGRTHQVVTGCCLLLPGGRSTTFHACTDVRMRTASPEELRAYVATGEPADKAGAYAIQGIGSFLVEHVHGSYTNVVGLPLAKLVEVLKNWGVIVSKRG
ncbi:MAG: nucleoside triphosphate pyrophosphatase [Desulfovibrio sp.]